MPGVLHPDATLVGKPNSLGNGQPKPRPICFELGLPRGTEHGLASLEEQLEDPLADRNGMNHPGVEKPVDPTRTCLEGRSLLPSECEQG